MVRIYYRQITIKVFVAYTDFTLPSLSIYSPGKHKQRQQTELPQIRRS